MIGKKYNKWTITGIAANKHSKKRVHTKCECGEESTSYLHDITSGKSKQCNLCANPNRGKKTHGLTKKHPLFGVFYGMKARCSNPNHSSYHNYGARGITCEWESIEDFLSDMKDSYSIGLEIDRIDVNGNYSKENCRWVTRKENASNKRTYKNKLFRGTRRMPSGRYKSQIKHGATMIYLGTYDTEKEAAYQYDMYNILNGLGRPRNVVASNHTPIVESIA